MSADKLTFNNSSNPVPSNTGLVALREFNGGPVAQRDFELNLSNIAHTVNDAIDDNSAIAQDLSSLRVSIASNESTQDDAISAALNNLRLEIAEQNTNDLQEAKNYAQTGDTTLAQLTDASIQLTNASLISVSDSLLALKNKVDIVVKEEVIGQDGEGVLTNVLNSPNLFESTMTLDSDKKGVTQKVIKEYIALVKSQIEATIATSDNTIDGSFTAFKNEVNLSIANVGARVNQLLTGNALRVKSASDSTALIDGDGTLLANSDDKLATQKAIKKYVDDNIDSLEEELTESITGIIDSAPDKLNTLNELAAAINDNENFSTTITNLITNTRVSLQGEVSGINEILTQAIVSLGSTSLSADLVLGEKIDEFKVSLGNRIFLTDQSANQRAVTLTNSLNELQENLTSKISLNTQNIGNIVAAPVVPGMPTGAVIPFAGGPTPSGGIVLPAGYLFCDGQQYSRTTYAALYEMIGDTYGAGDDITTFNVPDLRGRVVAGQDDMGGVAKGRLTRPTRPATILDVALDRANQVGDPIFQPHLGSGIEGSTLGATGGDEMHQLTEEELPAHQHTLQDGVGQKTNSFDSGTLVASDASGKTGSTGDDEKHNNVQPTIVLNYIIKT